MEVSSTKIQNNFGKYLKFSQFEDIVVTRNDKRLQYLKIRRGGRLILCA